MNSILMAMALSLVSAGEVKKDEPKPAPKAEPTKPALLPGGADTRRLKELLEGQGYEVKESKNDKGTRYLNITISAAKFDFYPSLALSPNRGLIWIHVPLNVPKNVPQEVVVKMMESHSTMSPFYFKKSGDMWYLAGPVLNKDMSPRALKAYLDNVTYNLASTEALWNEKKWATAPKVASK